MSAGHRCGRTTPSGSSGWCVVIGTHYAGALIAKDMGDSGPDRDRRFAFSLTHDHETVLAAARSLLTRVIATSAFPDVEDVFPDSDALRSDPSSDPLIS